MRGWIWKIRFINLKMAYSNKKIITIIFSRTVIFLVCFLFLEIIATEEDVNMANEQFPYSVEEDATVYHLSYRSNPKLYEMAYTGLEEESILKEKIYGGIVTHHFFASGLIAKFFKKLEKQEEIKTVVIVGPNHFEAGFGEALVSRAVWSTPFGDLEPNKEMIDNIASSGIAAIDENPFEMEHSISTLVPFVKKTFPEARIVPIILKEKTSINTCQRIARILYDNNANGDVLVIASVDFSHNLPLEETETEDARSSLAIAGFDFDTIYDLEADSPASIYALLYFLKLLGADNLVFSEQSNSFRIFNSSSNEGITGYFIGHFGLSNDKFRDL